MAFPQVGSRRLGSSGESKYHYIGLCLKKEISHIFYPSNKLSQEKYKIFQQCLDRIFIQNIEPDLIIGQMRTVREI